MQISAMGLIVFAGILIVGYFSRQILISSLMASVAFGATAVVTLPSLGGSSPLVFTFFIALLVIAVTCRRRIWQELSQVLGMRPIWTLSCIMVYAIVGAILLPRLFAGKTAVFVQSKTGRGAVVESALEPVAANISQTGYFILGGLTTIALCVLLLNGTKLSQVRRAFFVWCILHTGMGLLDFAGKLIGQVDVLEPIRTASYAMLTEVTEAGFWRIAGAYSEASAFGGASLACLAFTYTYWRKTNSALAMWLSVALLFLLIFSTSSTAYVSLAVLSIPVAISVANELAKQQVQLNTILILLAALFSIVAILGVSVFDERVLAPFYTLIDSVVLNKASSASGQERLYWNIKSLEALKDTAGLGVGFGSSRASSWPIAVLSQLGILGTLMMASLVIVIARGLGRFWQWVDVETDATVSSVRASALAGIVTGSVAGGSADPGIVFFVALAVVLSAKVLARRDAMEVIAQERIGLGATAGFGNRA